MRLRSSASFIGSRLRLILRWYALIVTSVPARDAMHVPNRSAEAGLPFWFTYRAATLWCHETGLFGPFEIGDVYVRLRLVADVVSMKHGGLYGIGSYRVARAWVCLMLTRDQTVVPPLVDFIITSWRTFGKSASRTQLYAEVTST